MEPVIKTRLEEIGCGGVDWINLVEAKVQWWALVNT
jgi:hypothetical protein